MHRRAFLRIGSASVVGASLPCVGCWRPSQGPPAATSRLTSLGLAGPLDMADAVADAGGAHIEESVSRFLVPDRPEADFEANLARANASPLPVIACNSFVPGRLKSVGPDADHDAVLAWAGVVFRRARRAGVRLIVFGSGGSRRVPEGFDPGAATDQFVVLLQRMGPLAARYGVTVCLEPLRPQEVNFLNKVAEAAALVKRVSHPRIRLTADLYHMMQAQETPCGIMAGGALIAHTHIAENQGRSTPGVHGEPFHAYFSALKQAGYVGPMSIEGKWKPDELARGFAVVREQWDQASPMQPPAGERT